MYTVLPKCPQCNMLYGISHHGVPKHLMYDVEKKQHYLVNCVDYSWEDDRIDDEETINTVIETIKTTTMNNVKLLHKECPRVYELFDILRTKNSTMQDQSYRQTKQYSVLTAMEFISNIPILDDYFKAFYDEPFLEMFASI